MLSDIRRGKAKLEQSLQTLSDSFPAELSKEKEQIEHLILDVKLAESAAVGVCELAKDKILRALDK
jgi:hypothetical protein